MVQRDRYGENLGVKTVIWGFAVCDEPRPWSRQCGILRASWSSIAGLRLREYAFPQARHRRDP